jgi:GT2 family glycosyltransferase
LYRYLEAEVLSTIRPLTEQLRAELAADRDAVRAHVTRLEGMLRELHEALSRDHRETQVRFEALDRLIGALRQQASGERAAISTHLAEVEGLVRTLRQQMTGEDGATRARLAELEHVIETLRERTAREYGALNDRSTKLELLLEHPDVLGVSREATFPAAPTVSIVMPTWNRGWLIGAAIRSVRAQTLSDWELIVVDDGSSDETAAIVAAFDDARIYYVAQSHSGQCRARNHALGLARGPLIAYLDSDNVWYPGWLTTAVAVFAAKPQVDCLYGAMVTDAHVEGEHLLLRPFDRERLLAGNYIGMSTFMHRRELVDRYGAFDEDLGSLEDWDLILRYTAHAPAYRLPALAVRYRVMDETRVSITAQYEDASARILAKWKQA